MVVVAEGAGAATVAAVLAGKVVVRLVVLVTGRNVTPNATGRSPRPDPLLTRLPDQSPTSSILPFIPAS